MVLVDSNVILDIFTNDPNWAKWSVATLQSYASSQALVINAIIYSEISLGFTRVENLDAALAKMGIKLRPIPKEALFLAATVFKTYRKQGGTKSSTLPDFFVGAHAATEKRSLITRDTKRYATYYPTVSLITP